ncbi:hypothetical protein CVT26_009839, partial [Gymnopilus dilepis]
PTWLLSPEEQQACIYGIAAFLQPSFDIVVDLTGWHLTCAVGGPEPADNGRLNVISIHAGQTKGDIKQNFGEHDPQKYQALFVPLFSDFLRKCFTREDCVRVALGPDTSSDLSILAPENVEHCHASGDNYGPSDGVPSQAAAKRNPRRKTRQDEDFFVPDSEEERNAGMEIDDDNDVEESSDGGQLRSQVAGTMVEADQGSDDESDVAHVGDSPAQSQEVSRQPAPSHTSNVPLFSSPLFSSPLFTSPARQFTPISPTRSPRSSPVPSSPSPTQRANTNVAVPVSTTSLQGPPPNAPQPSVRCGPPRKGAAAAGKNWRLKKSNAAAVASAPPIPALFASPAGDRVIRPPTASARVLVPSSPLLTQLPPSLGASSFDVRQNISQKFVDVFTGSGATGKENSTSGVIREPLSHATSSGRKRRDRPDQTEPDSRSKRQRSDTEKVKGTNDATTQGKRKVVFMGGPPFLLRLKPS